jgi:alkanesulfonate monooxygenase SsuD/methylene tetrahydromethanopterin reductase-like flavin-dependent oxidoreductase (luciferase family)
MKFGLALTAPYDRHTPAKVQIDEHRRLLLMAEELGFDFMSAGQHFLSPSLRYLQPIPYLAHLHTAVPSFRVATGILLLPLLHPVEVAENMATLDSLTGGKAIMGAGIGYADLEFDAFAVDRRTRTKRFEESIDVIRAIWTGEEVHHHGTYWNIDAPPNGTLPEQPGGPPIWLAGQTEVAVRRAARIGDAWWVPPFPTHDELVSLRKIYLEEREAHDRPPEKDFPVRRELFMASSKKEAVAKVGAQVRSRLETYVSWGMRENADVGGDFSTADEDSMTSRFILGPPDVCAQALSDLADIGMTTFILKPQWPGLPPEESFRQLEWFGTEVVPLVADR